MVHRPTRTVVVHPFLFAIYAVLGVYSRNSIEIPIQWVLRPLLVLLFLIAIIYYIAQRKTKDPQYAGLAATLLLFWLFFGHFQRALLEQSPFWDTAWATTLAFAAWTAPLGFLGSRWSWNHVKNRALITSFLNFTSIFVVLLPAYSMVGSVIQTIRQTQMYEAQRALHSPITLTAVQSPPDIYLIIMDAYGREDFLRELYSFDNREFIEALKQRKFYVADQSVANYPQTYLSISSLLNMQYLDMFTRDLQETSNRGPIINLLQDSAVRRTLKETGYDFVALPSASLATQVRDADLYVNMTIGDLNEFEGLLLSSTFANLAIDAWDLNVPVPSYRLHRQYVLFSLEKLETIANTHGPKMVFAHIMAPHPPFVLDRMGNPVQSSRPFNTGDASGFMGSPEEYQSGYMEEVTYLNHRLIEVIDSILANSDQPPIIILQGDHGPGNYFNMVEPVNDCLKERYSILNAYYFPDQDYAALYPTISPINSFRIVFNQYFGADLELLEDKSYYATWLKPYVFSDVSQEIQSCEIMLSD
jgi:hypothetical protein